jgi:hypothetical protein
VDSVKQNPSPDAANRLWAAIEQAHNDLAANRCQLGKLFFALRNIYSERSNSASRRLSSGHGVFQAEILKRGYKPNRVREWVNDYEVVLGLRKPSESTSAKRKARRNRESLGSAYDRGYEAASYRFNVGCTGGGPLEKFATLLPFEALQAAYRAAAKIFHPDLGGDSEQMQKLNAAWEAVEKHFEAAGETVSSAEAK